jgi:transcription initiation factor IIE alpha subunit
VSQIDLFNIIQEETGEKTCRICGQPFDQIAHEQCIDKLIQKVNNLENELKTNNNAI